MVTIEQDTVNGIANGVANRMLEELRTPGLSVEDAAMCCVMVVGSFLEHVSKEGMIDENLDTFNKMLKRAVQMKSAVKGNESVD